MAQDHKKTPKLSDRFSDLFGKDESDGRIDDDSMSLIYLEELRKLSLNKLLHLAPYSDVLLLLGDAGVGRTTLLRTFVKRAASSWRISFVSANALMDGVTLLRQIAKGFDFKLPETDSVDDLLSELDRYLQSLGRSGQRAIVIIDDAHLLADDVLLLAEKILRDERTENSVSLVVSMCSEQESKLDRFALLKEHLAYTLVLEPFNRKEVAGYLHSRLAGRIADIDSLLTPEVLDNIYHKSGGLPEEINRMAQALVSQGKKGKGGAGRSKARLVTPVIVIGVVAGVLFFYQDEINRRFHLLPEQQTVAGSTAKKAEKPVQEPDQTVATTVAPLGEEGLAMLEGTQEPLPIPLPADEVAQKEEPQTQTAAPEATLTEEKPAQKVETPPPAAKEKPAEPLPAKLSPEMQWLMDQPDGNYTMQLMALVDPELVRRYARDWKIAGKSAVYSVTKRGKQLTVLVYGSYPNVATAKKAAASLPRSWHVRDPWIRSFAHVKQDAGAKK
jgi:type II secretory pathway predicted ATPase ExeA